jgi:hypothetical protein
MFQVILVRHAERTHLNPDREVPSPQKEEMPPNGLVTIIRGSG